MCLFDFFVFCFCFFNGKTLNTYSKCLHSSNPCLRHYVITWLTTNKQSIMRLCIAWFLWKKKIADSSSNPWLFRSLLCSCPWCRLGVSNPYKTQNSKAIIAWSIYLNVEINLLTIESMNFFHELHADILRKGSTDLTINYKFCSIR